MRSLRKTSCVQPLESYEHLGTSFAANGGSVPGGSTALRSPPGKELVLITELVSRMSSSNRIVLTLSCHTSKMTSKGTDSDVVPVCGPGKLRYVFRHLVAEDRLPGLEQEQIHSDQLGGTGDAIHRVAINRSVPQDSRTALMIVEERYSGGGRENLNRVCRIWIDRPVCSVTAHEDFVEASV